MAEQALSAPADAVPAQDLEHLLSEAKEKIRHGDYPAAQALLNQYLAQKPNDPEALTYLSLCELRIKPKSGIPRLSDQQFQSLEDRLRAEEAQRRHAEKIRKEQQRVWEKETKSWDEEINREKEKAAAANKHHNGRRTTESPKAPRAPYRRRAITPASPTVQEETGASPQPPAAEQPPAPQPEPETPANPDQEESLFPVPGPGEGRPAGSGLQINARQMSVLPERNTAVAEGDVEVFFENAVLWCDKMTLFTDTGDVYAEGNVRLQQGKQFFRSEIIHYNFHTHKGRFLQGTVATPPWYQHGRTIETLAEGVYQVTPGYLTTCSLEPPHYRLAGRKAIVFGNDQAARVRDVAFFVEKMPLIYLPYVSLADKQMPFYLIPGKKKPWGAYVLGGYHFELPNISDASQKGTIKVDWRENFGFGEGVDYKIEQKTFGEALFKGYYNDNGNKLEQTDTNLPKGADAQRYRILWRHHWVPVPDTTVITDIQKFSDQNFRKDFLFRDEFVLDDSPESFVSVVKSTPAFTLSSLVKKRANRFEGVTEQLPQLTLDVRQQRIGDSWLFSKSTFDAAHPQIKRAHSEVDEEVTRLDWIQQLSYASNLLRPIELTPRAAVRQTYYTRDREGDDRNLPVGQFSTGIDASVKFFRIFPATTNAFGLNINGLRHVVTPTASYNYIHESTTPNALLDFPAASSPSNSVGFGLENKLQTRRKDENGKLKSVELARFLTELPYSFHGRGNEQGARFGNWNFKLETYPYPWLRAESNMTLLSHYDRRTLDSHVPIYNLDLVAVGGHGKKDVSTAPDIIAPAPQGFEVGPKGGIGFMPLGQWYLGLGHRYSANDKTEDVVQYDLRVSDKWQLTTFHRYTWKEVAGGAKRFKNLREFQYGLKRDLHDWVAEFTYRVDREYGEELFLTFTLKAFPDMPLQMESGYHQPKQGSQSSPFSPIHQ